jgi:hypothetical protein
MAQLEFYGKLRGKGRVDCGNWELRESVVPAKNILRGVATGVCVAVVSVAHF